LEAGSADRYSRRSAALDFQPSSFSTLAIAVVFFGFVPSRVVAYVGTTGLVAASILNVWLRTRQLATGEAEAGRFFFANWQQLTRLVCRLAILASKVTRWQRRMIL
jgi:hypothetical protein